MAGHPPVFRRVRMISEVFIPEPEATARMEAAGRTIAFNKQHGGSVAGGGKELEALEAGTARIGTCKASFDRVRLAVQNVTCCTPFVSSDARKVSGLIDRLHKTDPRMTAACEENGNVFLGAPVAIDDYLLMTTFPVTSMAGSHGCTIAAPVAAINWLSGTGVTGAAGNLATFFNEIKAGVHVG